jgi:glutaredoxin
MDSRSGLFAMLRRATILLALLLLSTSALSQIYRWKDKDGNVIVSTTPPPPGVEWEKREPERLGPNSRSRSAAGSAPTSGAEFARDVEDVRVIMYVTDWCPVCHKARAFLKSLGVKLVEHDVEKDAEQGKEWLRKGSGRKAVPLIDIEGTILVGFHAAKIRAAIEQKRIL